MPGDLCRPDVIRRILAEHGFRFDKRKGQNFLTASWVPGRMAALFSKGQAVLEIGPGFGALTAALAGACGHVAAVEKDRRLIPILRQNLSGFDNVTLTEGDALRLDLPSLLPEGFSPAVCANLPYSVTTPLLTRLVGQGRFDPIVVMVQREVARRLAANPSTPEYGAITVFTALHADCSILFDVGPDCFMPRPAVTSSVIRLDRLPPDPARECLVPRALRIVKAAFAARRKTLLNALSAGLSLPKEAAAERLTAAGCDPSARGETLSPAQYLTLARTFTDIITG
ncbi:MAG: 16S rRNA (adenine(1518)-N(6)/adenine(1519)-N(6))-dimethyltransferase RsmA [Oscillospiraceae bacterium]|jgi:16S rRNA (adenine1518-N6/adenine1519-N6)-dimethyltransferase|nr:16S rRNA (adenine(1518)-N(6)/adenine(1519)-N(6))-dimethyltransferase RsmA [Oscillospiraceae bacterium]